MVTDMLQFNALCTDVKYFSLTAGLWTESRRR